MNAPDLSWSWISLVVLGSFHGLNPAMGWLFAVAVGIQERRGRAVVNALGPIALGHALAIGAVVAVVAFLGTVLPQHVVMLIGGVSMLAFAAYKVASRFRHPAWVGMRVRGRELAAWSFLMATAHGAGLMLVPAILALRDDQVPTTMAHAGNHTHQHMAHAAGAGDGLLTSVLAVAVHTAAMFAIAGAIAVIVYRKVGVDILRRAWINMDLIWIGAIALTGMATTTLALLSPAG
jgi:hypothetical protein